MKRFFILFISMLTLMPVVAQTQEEIRGWYDKGLGLYKQGNYTEAIKWLTKAAEKGDVDAQFGVGMCYVNGQGVTSDHAEGMKWWTMAAEQDHLYAQAHLGQFYLLGVGIEKDPTLAAKWLTKAAEKGYAESQYLLGMCYDNGWGVKTDAEMAINWLKKSAEQNYEKAQVLLDKLNTKATEYYLKGLDLKKQSRYGEAAELWKKAAEYGLAKAQVSLGICYANGEGVPQDDTEVAKWIRKAAEQGDADAQ
jgi:TPR repeat protein